MKEIIKNGELISTEIKMSRRKVSLLFIGSCIFVAAGLWLLLLPDDHSIMQSARGYYAKPAGIAAIAFFGLTGLSSFVSLFRSNVALVLDAEGIHDFSTPVSCSYIPWHDVTGLEIKQMGKTRLLLVFLDHPELYMDNRAAWKRRLLKANYNMYGTPVSISSVALKTNFDQMQGLIKAYWLAYKELEREKYLQPTTNSYQSGNA